MACTMKTKTEVMGVIEAIITKKDGTSATVYATNFPELFSKLAYEQVERLDACTIDMPQMRQGKERSRNNENHMHAV